MSGSGSSWTGVGAAAIAVSAGIATAALVTDSRLTLSVLVLAGALLGSAVVLQSYSTPLSQTIAALLAPAVAFLSILGFVLGFLGGSLASLSLQTLLSRLLSLTPIVQLCAGFGAGIAVFGVIGSLRDGLGDGAVWGLFRSTVLTTVFVGLSFTVVFIRRQLDPSQQTLVQFDTASALAPVFAPSNADIGLLTLGLLIFVLAVVVRTGLAVLPLLEVAGRKHRHRATTVVHWLSLIAEYLALASLVLLGTGIVALGTGFVSQLLESQPVLQALRPLLVGVGIRPLLSWIILGCMVVTGTGLALQLLAGTALNLIQRLLPAVCSTVLLVLGSPVAGRAVQDSLAGVPRPVQGILQDQVALFGPTGIVLLVTGFALTMLCGVLFVTVLIGFFGWLPSRAPGGAIACTGLILVAIAIAIDTGPALAIFGIIALAFLTWDVTKYGVTIRTELDAVSATRIELIHVLGAGVVSALSVGLCWLVLNGIVTRIAVPSRPVALFALFAALCGAVLTLGLVRTSV